MITLDSGIQAFCTMETILSFIKESSVTKDLSSIPMMSLLMTYKKFQVMSWKRHKTKVVEQNLEFIQCSQLNLEKLETLLML